jgi:hypothetical protein
MKGPTSGSGSVYNVEQAVGRNSPNANGDVKLVQYMLKHVYGAQADGMVVDGFIGPITVGWIDKFQKDTKAAGVNVLADSRVDRAFAERSTVSKTFYTILALNAELKKRNPAAYAALPSQVPINQTPRTNPYNPQRKEIARFTVTRTSGETYEINIYYTDGTQLIGQLTGEFYIEHQRFNTDERNLIAASTYTENGKRYIIYLYNDGTQKTVELPASS